MPLDDPMPLDEPMPPEDPMPLDEPMPPDDAPAPTDSGPEPPDDDPEPLPPEIAPVMDWPPVDWPLRISILRLRSSGARFGMRSSSTPSRTVACTSSGLGAKGSWMLRWKRPWLRSMTWKFCSLRSLSLLRSPRIVSTSPSIRMSRSDGCTPGRSACRRSSPSLSCRSMRGAFIIAPPRLPALAPLLLPLNTSSKTRSISRCSWNSGSCIQLRLDE